MIPIVNIRKPARAYYVISIQYNSELLNHVSKMGKSWQGEINLRFRGNGPYKPKSEKKNKIASLSFFQRLIKNIDQSGNRRERNPVILFFRFWFVGTISPETENIPSVSMAAGRKRNARIMESPLGMIN